MKIRKNSLLAASVATVLTLCITCNTVSFAANDEWKDATIASLELYTDVSSTAPQVTPSEKFVPGTAVLYDQDFLSVIEWSHDKLTPNKQYDDGRPVDAYYQYGNKFYIQSDPVPWQSEREAAGLVYHWNEAERAWQFDCRYNWTEDQATRELVKDAMKKTLGEEAWKIWYIRTSKQVHKDEGGYQKTDAWTDTADGVQSKYFWYGDNFYSFLYRVGY
ncbi:MAG: hypothetical protein PHP50_05170 [Lachnospiraceae bacterium]|nr:hypothetical protein [Lachnospiraceae bacterium]